MNFTTDHFQQYPRQHTTGFVPIRSHQVDFIIKNCLKNIIKFKTEYSQIRQTEVNY